MVDTLLQPSKYVRTVRGGHEDFSRFGGQLPGHSGAAEILTYHSLFGNARLIDGDVSRLLRERRSGQSRLALEEEFGRDVVSALVEARYLVAEDHDELLEIQTLLDARAELLTTGRFHSALQLVLTNACNFSCKGCFAYNFDSGIDERLSAGESIKGQGDRPRRALPLTPVSPRPAVLSAGDWNDGTASSRNPSMHMSPTMAVKIVGEALKLRRRNGGGSLAVSFFGGEPTLAKRTIMRVLETYGRDHEGIHITYDITSNGSRIDEELASALATYGVQTTISIDYYDPETQEYRGGQAQTTPWSVVSGAVRELVDRGVQVSITSVLSEHTWPKWGEDLIDFVAGVGLTTLDVIVSFQAEAFFAIHSPEEVARRLLEAVDYGRSRGVQLSGYWYQTFLMIINEAVWAERADYKTCPAVGRQLSVEPNGSVFACKATARQLGSVDDWQAIFTSDEYLDYGMRAYTNGPGCQGCELQGTCSGGSAGALEEESGSIRQMSPGYCAYMREIVNGLLTRHYSATMSA